MRFERKYNIETVSAKVVEQVVRNHPAGFKKIYPDRQVNNIYFDTPNLTTFRENVMGVNQRKKVRLRWYGQNVNCIESPKLELKKKHNELGTKEFFDFENTHLSELSAITQKTNAILNNLMPLQPVLLNGYQRSYWGSADGSFRITIDTNLGYHSLLFSTIFQRFYHKETNIVLEIKYDFDKEDAADFIFQNIPFRQTKNSKYVQGVLMSCGL